MREPIIKQLTVLFLLLTLTACTPFVKDGQPVTASSQIILEDGKSIGQTFYVRDRGLQGIEIFLSPESIGKGNIKLHVREDSQSSKDLAVSIVSLESISAPGWVQFNFPIISDSRGKSYYFFVKLQGSGRVKVDTAPGDTYLDGALYQNGTPLDAQMTFQLVYNPKQLFIGLMSLARSWLGILGIAVFLFILPGWALLTWLWPGWDTLAWGEKLGLAGGLSIALYPLLFLWTDLIGLHLGFLYAWLPALSGLGILLWRYSVDRRSGKPNPKFHITVYDLTLLAILALIILTRFWVIRSLDVPMWGDSYQHTMIAQLLVDNGGLFNSWKPYAELQTFTYHFGFHSAAAVFHWISRMDMPHAVLWTGQILNCLAVITLYPLAVYVAKNRRAGIGAVLLAGLLSPMPMYYVNWGRYTQLAGQAILPVAIYLAWLSLEAKSRRTESSVLSEASIRVKWKRYIPFDAGRTALMWLILGGLALTHYRILIFMVLFFAAFFILQIRRETWKTLIARISWIGVGSGLLFLPWFIHTFAGRIILFFARQLGTPASAVSNWTQEYNTIGDLSTYAPIVVWLLFFISIVWGLFRRKKDVILITLWSLLVFLAANPRWLRLPGDGALSNFAVLIAAYIPISILTGYLLGEAANFTLNINKTSKYMTIILSLSLFVAGTWWARQRLGDFQMPPHILATHPDINAAKWIQENTSKDTRFLVNSFFAYNNSVIVGADGGWWLPLLAIRQTTLPPLNYGNEQGPNPNFGIWINELTTEIQNKGVVNPNITTLLHERNITHVYIGQTLGGLNYNKPYMLQPEQLLASPNFRLIYHEDRVWIFEILHKTP